MSLAATLLPTLIRVVAVLGGLFSLAVVFAVGDISSDILIVIGTTFAVWVAAPFALAWVIAPKFKACLPSGALVLAAVIAAVCFSAAVYWSAFFDNPKPDAQDGLVFVFVPVYQLAGLGIAYWLANTIAERLGVSETR